MNRLALIVSLCCSSLFFQACGGSSSNGGGGGGPATHFSVSSSPTATAGTAFNLMVTALNASNNTVTSFSGTVHFTSTDGQAVLPANSTLTNGTGTFSVTLMTSGSQTITVTDTLTASIMGTSQSITVNAPATHFSVTGPSNATTGVSFNFTVTALDASNNTVTTYSGMVHFTSSDPQAVLPANSTLMNGTGTFSLTLKSPGSQTVTATDTSTVSITGTSNSISVTGPATHFSVTGPSNASAGVSFNFTVTALDASNNTVTAYSGMVHFTSSDPQAVLPANSTLMNGTGSFSGTLKSLGSQTVTATDSVTASITGTSSVINVVSNVATHFLVTAPFGWGVGTGFSFNVKALDAANNVASTYSGTIHFTSTDPMAALPANSTLTNGTGLFLATLNTTGDQTITATDTANALITGTSNEINVGKFVITSGPPPNGTVGLGYGTASCAQPPQLGFTLTTNIGISKFGKWSGSSLPPGLKIGGFTCPGVPPIPIPSVIWLLYGVPTQVGTFNNVVITANDPFHGTASATYTITIAPAAAKSAAESKLDPPTQHDHYKVIDIGTFGGPSSNLALSNGVTSPGAVNQILNNQGTFVGWGDTSTLDPYASSLLGCFSPFSQDCFLPVAFQWQKDVRTELGVLPGGDASDAVWISDSGLIVGQARNGLVDPLIPGWAEVRAVLWKDGEAIDLGTLGGNESSAFSVNNRGQVVGLAVNTIPDPFSFYVTQLRAFLWQDGAMQDLGTLGGPEAWALFVNERGQVAGFSLTNFTVNPNTGSPTQDPFLWEHGTMLDLGTLGGTLGSPYALNNRGQVVGTSDLAGDFTEHPFLWPGVNGKMQDLGTLGGSFGIASGINDPGEVVGGSSNENDQVPLLAFLWKDGVMTNLGTLKGYDCSFASHINSNGQVVGASFGCATGPDGPAHGFLWQNGLMTDLNAFLPPGSDLTLVNAGFINDLGEIAGLGVLPDGSTRAVLLVPCGEGTEGCVDAVEGTAATTNIPAHAASMPTTSVAGWRARLAQRYHAPGLGAPQR